MEMLYQSINNGGCGFLLLWFLLVRKKFLNKPGLHPVTSFMKPGPAILTWPISFAPCLLILVIKSTKWRFLSSLFINRSFNTFRSIQCEQFKEKLSEIRGWVKLIVILRHIIAYFAITIRWHSQNVSSDSRKWLIKHLFPPSSCKKQINKQNSYLLFAFLQSGSVPELDLHESKHFCRVSLHTVIVSKYDFFRKIF